MILMMGLVWKNKSQSVRQLKKL